MLRADQRRTPCDLARVGLALLLSCACTAPMRARLRIEGTTPGAEVKLYERRGERRNLVESATELPIDHRVVIGQGPDAAGRVAAGFALVGLFAVLVGSAVLVVDQSRPPQCGSDLCLDLRPLVGGSILALGGILGLGGLLGMGVSSATRSPPPDALEVYVEAPGREAATRRVRLSELTEAGLLLDVDKLLGVTPLKARAR